MTNIDSVVFSSGRQSTIEHKTHRIARIAIFNGLDLSAAAARESSWVRRLREPISPFLPIWDLLRRWAMNFFIAENIVKSTPYAADMR